MHVMIFRMMYLLYKHLVIQNNNFKENLKLQNVCSYWTQEGKV